MPEITYGPRTDRRKPVDWIVVLPEVVLVEVKSAIPAEPVRLGTPDAADAALGKLGKAFKQIDITGQLIADRNTALAAVPEDRPVLGLAVTLEPFHMANAQFDPLPATPHAGHRGRRGRDRESGHDYRHAARPAASRPRRRRSTFHLVPRHRATRPRSPPEPGPGRSLGLLPVGISHPGMR